MRSDPWPARIPIIRAMANSSEGINADQLAELYQVNRNLIYSICKKHNIKLRPLPRTGFQKPVEVTSDIGGFMVGVVDKHMSHPGPDRVYGY